jgi:hypothetical protein
MCPDVSEQTGAVTDKYDWYPEPDRSLTFPSGDQGLYHVTHGMVIEPRLTPVPQWLDTSFMCPIKDDDPEYTDMMQSLLFYVCSALWAVMISIEEGYAPIHHGVERRTRCHSMVTGTFVPRIRKNMYAPSMVTGHVGAVSTPCHVIQSLMHLLQRVDCSDPLCQQDVEFLYSKLHQYEQQSSDIDRYELIYSLLTALSIEFT